MLFLEVASSLFFWAGIIPIFLLLSLWRIEEHGESGFVAFMWLAILTFLQSFTDVKPFTYIWDNPFHALWLGVAYAGVGVLYIWLKWTSFVHAVARKKKEWESQPMNKDRKLYGHDIGARAYPVKVGNYKSDIFGWFYFWPLSGAWTLLNDPLRRLFNAVYGRIAGSLQKIADKALGQS